MKRSDKANFIQAIFTPLIAAATLLCFLLGLDNLSRGRSDEDLQRLEAAIRQAAVACYATEGFYPADIDYLMDRYGLQIDSSRYSVSYVAIGENLMPDITVLER